MGIMGYSHGSEFLVRQVSDEQRGLLLDGSKRLLDLLLLVHQPHSYSRPLLARSGRCDFPSLASPQLISLFRDPFLLRPELLKSLLSSTHSNSPRRINSLLFITTSTSSVSFFLGETEICKRACRPWRCWPGMIRMRCLGVGIGDSPGGCRVRGCCSVT